jgi:hypothetical protein
MLKSYETHDPPSVEGDESCRRGRELRSLMAKNQEGVGSQPGHT